MRMGDRPGNGVFGLRSWATPGRLVIAMPSVTGRLPDVPCQTAVASGAGALAARQCRHVSGMPRGRDLSATGTRCRRARPRVARELRAPEPPPPPDEPPGAAPAFGGMVALRCQLAGFGRWCERQKAPVGISADRGFFEGVKRASIRTLQAWRRPTLPCLKTKYHWRGGV